MNPSSRQYHCATRFFVAIAAFGAPGWHYDLAQATQIITGADIGSPPRVKRFDGASLAETASFFAYGPGSTGVYVAGIRAVVPEPTSLTLILLSAMSIGLWSSSRFR